MSAMKEDAARRRRLAGFFFGTLAGRQKITSSQQSKLFIEAICNQDDAVDCVERLISSSDGLPALQQSMRTDLSPTFLNASIATLLRYLQTPELMVICGGSFLRKVVVKIVEPPIFWNAFLTAQMAHQLQNFALQGFSWLLLQLVSLPEDQARDYYATATDAAVQKPILDSSEPNIRIIGHKIKHVLEAVQETHHQLGDGPGSRHDNDFADFRQIAIVPTVDELASKEMPYLRRSAEIDQCPSSDRFAMHLDNQFRLLREDMMLSLREDLQTAVGLKKGRFRGLLINGLRMVGLQCDDRRPWSILLQCTTDLAELPNQTEQARKEFLTQNRKVLPHESLACLIGSNQQLLTLVTINRDEDLLAKNPPVLSVIIPVFTAAMTRTLVDLKMANEIKLVQLNTALFAYQPILKQLQEIRILPLKDDLLTWVPGQQIERICHPEDGSLTKLVAQLIANPSHDIRAALDLPKSTKLDASQALCLIAGITQRLSEIQGPPGTGKSFIGALIAKAIYRFTKLKILVVCFTNHALDQFLEDLMETGISSGDIVRLGSAAKSSSLTMPLNISNYKDLSKFTRSDYSVLNSEKQEAQEWSTLLEGAFDHYQAHSIAKHELMEYLEFSAEHDKFHEAFTLPEQAQGMTTVGRKGKAIDKFYLLDRWVRGQPAGPAMKDRVAQFPNIWAMTRNERNQLWNSWKQEILRERAARVIECGTQYNERIANINSIFNEKTRRAIKEKRVVGCTTTAAAKYVQQIQGASPEVLLVEEAGEILESHILTALGPQTQQLILIGDHKQLRPKTQHNLSVEKGDDYNLNRSLFERLVLKGYPHETLIQQHRMRPEISSLVRNLTYPELTDAPSTGNRDDLRGFRDNVVFVSHETPEEESHAPDRGDVSTASTKKNSFEAHMTLKAVRYLAQQGYRADEVVVLTPYLGQLRLLFDVLKAENDPVLNDMDSYDLVRAGLMPAATAKAIKTPLRISTIDNYQGEESKIVLVSLTRSNDRGDIGFLSSPERLNVLLSRARDALILIGNVSTFLNARKGKDLWQKFLKLLADGKHIYDGFPVKCERHPDRTALLSSPSDFEKCPDGGCNEPCKSLLRCGHSCPQRCHQLFDHSKISCYHILQSKCDVGHVQSWKCADGKPTACPTCLRQKGTELRRLENETKRKEREERAKQDHFNRMALLEAELEKVRLDLTQQHTSEEMEKAHTQKLRELEEAKKLKSSLLSRKKMVTMTAASEDSRTMTPCSEASAPNVLIVQEQSPSESEWERQKEQDGISIDSIDSLMKMTGLEEVKQQFLRIKARIDVTQRQGGDLKKERFGIVLLGNPGTGKTTVARLYAKFLTSTGVIPGCEFVESTGARLASDGVQGVKKLLESITKAGGGAFFLDEAYQLASGHNPGGASVLDFLLAEIENQAGKIVFIFAGYTKQMEKFFEHNPGLESRMPYRLHFADYSDLDLVKMLDRLIQNKYEGRMKVEGGLSGLYIRIVARRVGRGRGREGFGNARALENVLAKISERQAERLQAERVQGKLPDDLFFSRGDLIGPDPSKALLKSSAWDELQRMIGLDAVKKTVAGFIDRVQTNYDRELNEKSPIEVSLNRVFLGSPGTGKTTVGKLYAQVLADLGLLSSSEIVLKDPADFIGGVLGESEKITKAILKSATGKVLIIDEAYMLSSATGNGGTADPYRAAVIDTLVSEIQSTPGEDRCVLLLGYQEQMEEMFQKVNPGLARRFPLDSAFHFEDFTDDQLLEILNFKLNKQALDATPEAKTIAIEVLAKARRRPNFGNAGEVENLISRAKDAYQVRQSVIPRSQRSLDVCFEPPDFDASFDRGKNAILNCRDMFKDVVGCETMTSKLEGLIQSVAKMRARDINPEDHIPFNFIFKGPPGTGKTTTARKMGQIFYDMGFLASCDVHECSATDFIGQFVGQTGPKTIEVLKKGLGKVLFIDEAYRFAEGSFAKEAIDELVDCLTKPIFKAKIIVILAGYERDINQLLSINPGLSSRFPEEFIFQNMSAKSCVDLLERNLAKAKLHLGGEKNNTQELGMICDLFHEVSQLPGWGNGRDIETLSKRIIQGYFERPELESDVPAITYGEVLHHLGALRDERKSRTVDNHGAISKPYEKLLAHNHPKRTLSPPSISTGIVKESIEEEVKTDIVPPGPSVFATSSERDDGVSDEVWNQLEQDKTESIRVEAARESQLATAEGEALLTDKKAATLEEIAGSLPLQQQSNDDEEANERKRRHEAMRLKALAERRKADEAREKLSKLLQEKENAKKQDAVIQRKLQQIGQCVAGYRWIKQANGYRCAGGSHFVDNIALGI